MTRKDIRPILYQFDTPLRFNRENFLNKEDVIDYIKIALLRAQIPSEIETLSRDIEEKTYSGDILKQSALLLKNYKTAQRMLDDAGQEQDVERRKEMERGAYLYVINFKENSSESTE